MSAQALPMERSLMLPPRILCNIHLHEISALYPLETRFLCISICILFYNFR